MEIWIVIKGEKSGPHQEYEIRRMFEGGEINGDTPVWHAHLDGWRPLREVEGLKHLAAEVREAEPAAPEIMEDPAPPPLPVAGEAAEGATSKPAKAHLGRRFWARWLDLCLYSALWWLLMWVTKRDIGMMFGQPLVMVLHYVPWFAIEAWMIHRFSTTPGKWLLGIKVLNEDGSALDLGSSILRCLRVLFMGIGFGIQPLAVICQALSWITARSLGRPLWDRAGGHLVDVRPRNNPRAAACALLLLFSLWLESIVLMPHYLPDMIQMMEQYAPKAAEEMKANPPWHLPENH